MVFLSGQIPVDPATGEFVPGGVTEQTIQVFENIKNVLAEAGLTTANIVKTTVFLADMSLFAEMNAVYAKYFEGDFPARSAVAVKALPKRSACGDREHRSEIMSFSSPIARIDADCFY